VPCPRVASFTWQRFVFQAVPQQKFRPNFDPKRNGRGILELYDSYKREWGSA